MTDTNAATAETMTAMAASADGTMTAVTIARPEPGPTEVLIKVGAAGINPVDWKTRNGGAIGANFDPSAPMILGWDVAGEVVAVGAGVNRFAVGDRVFGMPRFPRPASAYAEYAVAGSREVARTPDNISDTEAGALPLAVLTAWQAVIDTFDVQQGQRILIHAASGGVGHLAVQLAKARGAEVWGTANPAKHDELRSLGLDHAIDYNTEKFEEVATGMDAVLDLVGSGDYPSRSLQCIKPGGRLLVIPSPINMPSDEALEAADVTCGWLLVEPDYAALEQVAAMIEAGTLKVVVGETRPLTQVAELHAIGEAGGGPLGKLVATVP